MCLLYVYIYIYIYISIGLGRSGGAPQAQVHLGLLHKDPDRVLVDLLGSDNNMTNNNNNNNNDDSNHNDNNDNSVNDIKNNNNNNSSNNDDNNPDRIFVELLRCEQPSQLHKQGMRGQGIGSLFCTSMDFLRISTVPCRSGQGGRVDLLGGGV